MSISLKKSVIKAAAWVRREIGPIVFVISLASQIWIGGLSGGSEAYTDLPSIARVLLAEGGLWGVRLLTYAVVAFALASLAALASDHRWPVGVGKGMVEFPSKDSQIKSIQAMESVILIRSSILPALDELVDTPPAGRELEVLRDSMVSALELSGLSVSTTESSFTDNERKEMTENEIPAEDADVTEDDAFVARRAVLDHRKRLKRAQRLAGDRSLTKSFIEEAMEDEVNADLRSAIEEYQQVLG